MLLKIDFYLVQDSNFIKFYYLEILIIFKFFTFFNFSLTQAGSFQTRWNHVWRVVIRILLFIHHFRAQARFCVIMCVIISNNANEETENSKNCFLNRFQPLITSFNFSMTITWETFKDFSFKNPRIESLWAWNDSVDHGRLYRLEANPVYFVIDCFIFSFQ